MKRLYLVRHGQTSWNLEGRTQGNKDSDLTVLGQIGRASCRERV